ncbi:MAG: hypothetical protein ABI378_11945 [Chitinophagaceae bacterium]
MQGAKDFYRIEDLTCSDGQLSCLISFNEAHEIFQGHFPGNPIVPGVCTIGIVKEVLAGVLGESLLLSTAATIKYLGLIKPDMQVKLDASWTLSENSYLVNAKISIDVDILFKMTAQYRLA